jgi:hypothetical protein
MGAIHVPRDLQHVRRFGAVLARNRTARVGGSETMILLALCIIVLFMELDDWAKR